LIWRGCRHHPSVDAFRWLNAFPSFGFVLSVEPNAVAEVCARFEAAGVACAAVGEVTASPQLELVSGRERALYGSVRAVDRVWALARAGRAS